MKITKTFENATLRTVNNGYIELDYNGKTHCFNNASVVSVNNGTIIIETEWEPEEGELVKITGNCIDAYSIFRSYDKSVDAIVVYGQKRINSDSHAFCQSYWFPGSQTEIHPVTPEEQQAFDDFCKSKGKIWNKEKLQWEKYIWMPKKDEKYYYINTIGEVAHTNNTLSLDQLRIEFGNCFQTKEEAEAKFKQIKEILNSTI